MALKLKWPFAYKIIKVAWDGKFGRKGKFDWYYPKGVKTRLPHQGSDYRIPCGIKWKWPLSGTIDLFEKRNYGYGYYVRIKATNGYYFGIAHNSEIYGWVGKKVKDGSYGGKTGSTGAGKGCHAHVEIRNPQGRVVNPENVVQWGIEVEEVTETESKVKSFIYLYRAILNRHPSATQKKYFLYLAKKGTDPATFSRTQYLTPKLSKLNTTIKQQSSQIKTLSGQIENIQKGVKESTDIIDKDGKTIIDMGVDILTLKNKLQDYQKGFQEPVKEVNNLKAIKTFLGDILSRFTSRKFLLSVGTIVGINQADVGDVLGEGIVRALQILVAITYVIVEGYIDAERAKSK